MDNTAASSLLISFGLTAWFWGVHRKQIRQLAATHGVTVKLNFTYHLLRCQLQGQVCGNNRQVDRFLSDFVRL